MGKGRWINGAIFGAIIPLVILVIETYLSNEDLNYIESLLKIQSLETQDTIRLIHPHAPFEQDAAHLDSGPRALVNHVHGGANQPFAETAAGTRPGHFHRAASRVVRADTAAVSRQYGLFGGVKIDYREACLGPYRNPDRLSAVKIITITPDGSTTSRRFGDNDQLRMTAEDYALLSDGEDDGKDRFIKKFKSRHGCYAVKLDNRFCVVAVAISKRELLGSSVRQVDCAIEGTLSD